MRQKSWIRQYEPIVVVMLAVILVLFANLAFDPQFRIDVFGEFGWRYLIPLHTKVAIINERYSYKERGEQVSLGCSVSYIPYSGEFIRLSEKADPTTLEVIPAGAMLESRALHSEDGTFVIDSAVYPIRLHLQLGLVESAPSTEPPHSRQTMYRIKVRAESLPILELKRQ